MHSVHHFIISERIHVHKFQQLGTSNGNSWAGAQAANIAAEFKV
jgi:hypothetical protein